MSGNPKFFLGTDSAPHPVVAKRGGADGKGKIAAGVFTQPYATQYVLSAFEEGIEQGLISESDVSEEKLAGFLNKYGSNFYEVHYEKGEKIVIEKGNEIVVESVGDASKAEVVPFRRGKPIWSLKWV